MLKKIFEFFLRYSVKSFYYIIALSLFSTAVTGISFLLLRELILAVSQEDQWWPTLLYACCLASISILTSVIDFLYGKHKEKLEYLFKALLLKFLEKTSIDKFEDREFGSNYNYVLQVSFGQFTAIFTTLQIVFSGLLSLSIYLYLIALYVPRNIPIVGFSIILIVIGVYYISKYSSEIFRQKTHHYPEMNYLDGLVINNWSYREIYFLDAIDFLRTKSEFIQQNINSLNNKLSLLNLINLNWGNVILFVMQVLIAHSVISSSVNNTEKVANLVVIITILNMMKMSILTLVSNISSLKLQMIGFLPFVNLIEGNKEEQRDASLNINHLYAPILSSELSIKVTDLIIQIEGYNIIKNANFTIKRGEKIAVIGINGSGKTTLLKSIGGLLKPTGGEISLYSDIKGKSSKVAFMFQLFSQMHLSLIDSITMGNLFDQKKYNDILRVCNLEFLESLDGNTQLGKAYDPFGLELSGGQWQKIAIARTLYRSANIYLFDEPTSMIDIVTEKQLILNILDYLEEKTVIISTHNLELCSLFDRILLIDNGIVRTLNASERISFFESYPVDPRKAH